VRRHAKAILAHSAVDLFPEEIIAGDDEDLLSLVVVLGELNIRLRDLDCNGDWGAEFERWRAWRAAALTSSLGDSFFCRGAGDFIASLRALSVELTTSVANIDRSFGDNRSPSSCISPTLSAFVARGFAGAFAVFDLAATVALAVFAVIDFCSFDFGDRSSLSCVTVAGEHVEVEVMAARTKSAVA
jgi:hypothetical protein